VIVNCRCRYLVWKRKCAKCRGTGGLIFINAEYISLVNDSLNLFKYEMLYIRTSTGVNRFVNLGVCYRSPNAPREEIENL